MEFGRLPIEEIDTIDFTLPPDPSRNAKVLPGKPAKHKIYIGMPKWGRTEWAGPLYPPKTKEKDFLSHYVQYFNCVELNATHYKLYGSGGIGKWADMARGKDFKFCPKMYKGITHKAPLAGKEFMVNEFLRGVEAFGEHLGPIFIQFSESFSVKRNKDLFLFLESLPDRKQFFVEVRHPSWYENEKFFDYLQQKGFGIIITDTAGRRDVAHMNLTIPKAMIRFIANNHVSDDKRITDWTTRIKYWLDNGLEEVYFFIHSHLEREGLPFVQYVINEFNKVCDAKVPPLLLND